MTILADLGVTIQTSRQTQTTNVMGVTTVKEFAIFDCALPRAPKVQASFSEEGLANKLVKLFKKELQVGDKTFDDAVYVSTDTPDETAAFLRSEAIQNTILMCVTGGGSIEIHGKQVIAKLAWSNTNEDPALIELLRVLLA